GSSDLDQRGLQRALEGHLAGGHRLLPAWLGLAVDVLVPARSSPVRPGPAGAGESDDAEASMCPPEELQSRVEFVPNITPPNWCGNQEHAAFFGRNFRTLTCPNTGAYDGELWWRIIARESRACCSWAPGQEWALTVPGSPALTVPGSPASSGWWWPGAGAADRHPPRRTAAAPHRRSVRRSDPSHLRPGRGAPGRSPRASPRPAP